MVNKGTIPTSGNERDYWANFLRTMFPNLSVNVIAIGVDRILKSINYVFDGTPNYMTKKETHNRLLEMDESLRDFVPGINNILKG
jgi:hypothetical protein